MQDILKSWGTTIIVGLFGLAGAYIEHIGRVQAENGREAANDTILLFIQHQHQQNEKLKTFFASLDSANKLRAVADSTKGK